MFYHSAKVRTPVYSAVGFVLLFESYMHVIHGLGICSLYQRYTVQYTCAIQYRVYIT